MSTRHCELRLKLFPFQSKSEHQFNHNDNEEKHVKIYQQTKLPNSLDLFVNETESVDMSGGRESSKKATNDLVQSWLSDDKTAFETGRLMEQKEELQSQINAKDQSLLLWKRKEREYENEARILRRRIDEMGKVIRAKEREVDHMKYTNSQHLEEIRSLHVKLKTRQRPGASDQPTHNHGHTTHRTQGGGPIKLPTIIKRLDENSTTNSIQGDGNRDAAKKESTSGDKRSNKEKAAAMGISIEKQSIGSQKSLPQSSFHEALRFERWIDAKGYRVVLPYIALNIPQKALLSSTLFSVTILDQASEINEKFANSRLQDIAKHVVQIRFEPNGFELNKDIHVDVMNLTNSEQVRYLVYTKDVNTFEKTSWSDVTETCSPRFLKTGSYRISIGKLCAVQIIQLSVPLASSPTANMGLGGYAVGKNAHPKTKPKAYYDDVNTELVTSVLNDFTACLDVALYHSAKGKCLVVHITESVAESDDNVSVVTSSRETIKTAATESTTHAKENGTHNGNKSGEENSATNYEQNGISSKALLVFLNKATTYFPVCDKDRLYFYFDGQKKWQLHSTLNLDEIRNGGRQNFKMPLSNKKGMNNQTMKLPKLLTITRRFSDRLDEQALVAVRLQKCRQSLGENEASVVNPDHVVQTLGRVRTKVIQTVDIRYILDLMHTKGLFTFDEQHAISSEKTPQGRANRFLDTLATKGWPGLNGFCVALEPDYNTLAMELRALMQIA